MGERLVLGCWPAELATNEFWQAPFLYRHTHPHTPTHTNNDAQWAAEAIQSSSVLIQERAEAKAEATPPAINACLKRKSRIARRLPLQNSAQVLWISSGLSGSQSSPTASVQLFLHSNSD